MSTIDIRKSVQSVLATSWSYTDLRAALTVPRDVMESWQGLWELGASDLLRPEEQGGLGLGLREAVPVAQEIGRALLPGIGSTSLLLVPWLFATVGREHEEDSEGIDPLSSSFAIAVSGPAPVEVDVPGLGFSTEVLVALGVDDGAEVYRYVASDTRAAQPAGDRDDPWQDGRLLDVDVRRAGTRIGSISEHEFAYLLYSYELLQSAEMAGALASLTDLTAAYANQREQFGRPIVSFQAVRHRLADMAVALFLLESACSRIEPFAPQVFASRSSVVPIGPFLTDVYVAAAESAIQLHGAMGFTWEAEPHLFLRHALRVRRIFRRAHALSA